MPVSALDLRWRLGCSAALVSSKRSSKAAGRGLSLAAEGLLRSFIAVVAEVGVGPVALWVES